MPMESLVIPRAAFSIEEPWIVPPICRPVRLLDVSDGSAPRMETTVAGYHDGHVLTVIFEGQDDLVVAWYTGHDEPLWEHDVVEIFLAPAGLTEYYELEVNPLGTTFDARLESPDGHRQTMRTDLAWTCQGLFAAISTDIRGESRRTSTVVRIPFQSLGRTPQPEEVWRGNFFRIDRHPERGDEFLAWRPTGKTPPDFHVPAVFGQLRFL